QRDVAEIADRRRHQVERRRKRPRRHPRLPDHERAIAVTSARPGAFPQAILRSARPSRILTGRDTVGTPCMTNSTPSPFSCETPPMSIDIKICGLKTSDAVEAALAGGASHVGFI